MRLAESQSDTRAHLDHVPIPQQRRPFDQAAGPSRRLKRPEQIAIPEPFEDRMPARQIAEQRDVDPAARNRLSQHDDVVATDEVPADTVNP